jgi:hypothetical protein
MPRADRYLIVDEPVPSPWTRLAVSPTAPMFGFMLGGAWLGWLWFLVNSHAFGSATRRRESAIALLAPLGASGLLLGLSALRRVAPVPDSSFQYALLLVVVFKVATFYWLYGLQMRSFGLYEYFGGRRRNPAPVLVLALLVGRPLLLDAPPWVSLVLQ